MSPPKGLQTQKFEKATEQSWETQTANGLVPFLNSSKNCQSDMQETNKHTTATLNGDSKIPTFRIRTPQIEEKLEGNKQTKDLYHPLSPTVVLKRQEEMLNVPLEFR